MKFRKNQNCYFISTKNKNDWDFNDWVIFYWGWRFDVSYEICGYFDNRPRINLDLIFFNLTIVLPFRNKWANECDSPKWGISIHNNTLWVYKGGKGNMKGGNKWWTWNIPFISKEWVRTSILLKGKTEEENIMISKDLRWGNWEHETKGNRKDFYKSEWKEKQASWTYDYTDSHDGKIIPTTIYVDEREWRPKWLKWTSLFAKTRRTIDVHFSKEVGKRKGSWKGGTLGCGYELLPNEHPLDCLKRMEKERMF